MGSKRSVWVSVGKTHHQAWLVEGGVDLHAVQAINQKRNDGQVLIQWESVRYTEWVPRSSVHFEIPSIRRRPAKKSESRCDRSNAQQSDFALTKTPDCVLQHSDMTAVICPHQPHEPIKSALNKREETTDVDGATCSEEKLIVETTPRVLEFSDATLPSNGNTTNSRPNKMKISSQHLNCVNAQTHTIKSKPTGAHNEPEESQISPTSSRRATRPVEGCRTEKHTGKNIRKLRQNIKFKSKHKSFTLRDLEQDGNFTETQLRVFNELLTGKTLFSPPSLKKIRWTLSCPNQKQNQKPFFLCDKH